MKKLIIFFTLPLYLSFNFLQLNNLEGNEKMPAVRTVTKDSKIVYLFFKVEKTASGPEKITLQEKKTVDGKLKSNVISDESNGAVGDFIIAVSDTNGKEITKQVIEDPLNPSREVYGETISRNKISLENAEFSIRYSDAEAAHLLKVEKITRSGRQLLLTQRL